MPKVSWDTPLKEWQLAGPVIHHEILSDKIMDRLEVISDEDFDARFTPGKSSLQTWGRIQGVKKNDAHHIGIRRGLSLHTDPGYPRWTHQIMLRVDDYVLRGINKVEVPLIRGSFHILDTWSPHEVLSLTPRNDGGYIALSIDHDYKMGRDDAIVKLLRYGYHYKFAQLEEFKREA